uniref:Reverse transcriptase zinc-binding domain-containing protein n=1 Tax=Lactuca sativa TaxID=4236 RepID=A0A9R1X498_LACSA|nr:hypothetical protein LSAT_V11C600304690 [Lactuca sativa]
MEKLKGKLSIWTAKTLSFGGRVTLAKAKIMAPKKVGGLGLGSIHSLNLALLTKWLWHLKNEPNSLWVKIIRGLHNLNEEQFCTNLKSRWSGVWRSIVKCKAILNRINIPFEEVMKPGESSLGWVSPFVVDEEFCVALLHERIERATFPVCDGFFRWLKMIPLKVLGFIWRAKKNKIASAGALRNRGIEMTSTLCGVCQETGDHILVSCSLAKGILHSILKWCNVQVTGFHTVTNIIDFASKWGNCPKRKNINYDLVWCFFGVYRGLEMKEFLTKLNINRR